MPTKNKTQNKWRNRYVPWSVRSFCCLSVLNICCHHPNIIKIYWLILEDEPLEKYFTTSPNAVSGLSVVNQSNFPRTSSTAFQFLQHFLIQGGPSGCEGLHSLLIIMFHRAVNKFQNKWHWNEELNKFWGDVVQGGRNILGSRYGEREFFFQGFFLSWVGRGS